MVVEKGCHFGGEVALPPHLPFGTLGLLWGDVAFEPCGRYFLDFLANKT